MVVMTRSRRRKMAEATVESPTTILPEEVMIEILYRVELNSTLQLRCVCKLWKSLVHDSQFVKNHLFKLLNDITVLFSKTAEQFNAFKSQHLINNPVVPQEQEQEQVVDEDGEDAAQEDDNAAAEEGDAADEEEEEDEKHWLMTALAKLDGVLLQPARPILAKDGIRLNWNVGYRHQNSEVGYFYTQLLDEGYESDGTQVFENVDDEVPVDDRSSVQGTVVNPWVTRRLTCCGSK
ncbi:F-box-like protein [Medicago truncatula]|uniref:F-box-like protein n=1 Tax=Medicago truncatula TaxID=3880 RepID=G7ISL8_MEDTR|nr:F-box-like protein [Medicago truncatula]